MNPVNPSEVTSVVKDIVAIASMIFNCYRANRKPNSKGKKLRRRNQNR